MSESIPALFEKSVNSFKKRSAIQYFCPKKQKWITKNFLEVANLVNQAAFSLTALNLENNSRIAILSNTRAEWVIADLAILKSGLISVPIYQSNLPDQIFYILKDANVEVIFIDNYQQLEKLRQVQKKGIILKKIIVFENHPDKEENEIFFDDFLAKDVKTFKGPNLSKNSLASIVYTSGTTGEPKGAMITHDNLLYEAHVIDQLGVLSEQDVQLLFLPLAHIFARVLEFAWLRTGHLLAFAKAPDTVIDDMAEVKPTFMAAVPRLYEKVMNKVINTALEGGFIKRNLAEWAFRQAQNNSDDFKTFLAKKLVFKKIGKKLLKKMGGRLRFFVSGGASLSLEVGKFFLMADIIICEGYGLTETSAATCLNLPWSLKLGTVGKPVPGTSVKIADDGEILVKGRGVFQGFWQKALETKEVFNEEGWFKTGDIGQIDKDGFVKIVDRKKDIIVTSQGKNIAPQMLENLIKAKSPLIAHVVVIGEKKPYLTALIALEKNEAQKQKNNQSYEEVKKAIDSVNASLASFEQIKRFLILDKEFVIGEELTPTLKVKRKYCQEKFQKQIRILYA